jgi:hypothetical protein
LEHRLSLYGADQGGKIRDGLSVTSNSRNQT